MRSRKVDALLSFSLSLTNTDTQTHTHTERHTHAHALSLSWLVSKGEPWGQACAKVCSSPFSPPSILPHARPFAHSSSSKETYKGPVAAAASPAGRSAIVLVRSEPSHRLTDPLPSRLHLLPLWRPFKQRQRRAQHSAPARTQRPSPAATQRLCAARCSRPRPLCHAWRRDRLRHVPLLALHLQVVYVSLLQLCQALAQEEGHSWMRTVWSSETPAINVPVRSQSTPHTWSS